LHILTFFGQAAPFPIQAYTHADVKSGFDAIKKHWPDSDIRVAVWNAALFVRKGFLELSEAEIEESTRACLLLFAFRLNIAFADLWTRTETNIIGAFAFAREALLAFKDLE
jgi:NAD(P)-dependent dehydrogenase (short-subunit alcohol dehydrogenase family)